ncbi:cell envelope integrity protein CreD [Roseibium denhamense]|uniref:cell envelope integrity protein CreD n=1 Tax=Roseibium denhamense TaxID=76305 RepID=UPI001AD91610|nr:cell envelope integrity protein CreD [Roseibium denhamense]
MKLVLIGLLTLMLVVPTTFVWVLVEERADRARDVAQDIARSWGGTQQINGPYLVVPYTETFVVTEDEKEQTKTHRYSAVLFPERLEIAGDVAVEERQKSIYKLPVYSSQLNLSGRFSSPPSSAFDPQNGGLVQIEADKAVLVVGIGDVRALKSEVSVSIGTTGPVAFEPGLAGLMRNRLPDGRHGASGINAAIPERTWRQGFSFDIPLNLNGSTALYFAPAGQTTSLRLASDWPHPGFTGAFLPDSRTIAGTGFEAEWSIPYLARGIPKVIHTSEMPLQDKLLGVKFVDPVNFYQTISRSLKYAVGFISLTFLAVFVLEVRSGWQFHWIQYGLVGLALIIFYVMLLAFAEHVGYGFAYLIAASAATALNAAYVGSSLKSAFSGVVMAVVMASIFGVLFALMREQDYALLIGSVIAFVALAVTMFVTQRLDWSGGEPLAARPAE